MKLEYFIITLFLPFFYYLTIGIYGLLTRKPLLIPDLVHQWMTFFIRFPWLFFIALYAFSHIAHAPTNRIDSALIMVYGMFYSALAFFSFWYRKLPIEEKRTIPINASGSLTYYDVKNSLGIPHGGYLVYGTNIKIMNDAIDFIKQELVIPKDSYIDFFTRERDQISFILPSNSFPKISPLIQPIKNYFKQNGSLMDMSSYKHQLIRAVGNFLLISILTLVSKY